MPTAKMVIEFRYGDFGWSEVWWATYGVLLTELEPQIDNYCQTRLALSGTGVAILNVRISTVGVALSEYTYVENLAVFANAAQNPSQNLPGQPVLQQVQPIVNTPPADPYSALLMKWQSPNFYRRNMYMRGIPDGIDVRPKGYTPSQAYKTGVFNLGLAISQLKWFFQPQDRNDFPRFPIQSMVSGTPPTINAANANFPMGSKVKVGGFRNMPGYRYTGFIATTALGTFTLLGMPNIPASLTQVHGWAQQQATTNITPTQVSAVRLVKKGTGRPFGLPVGRRKRPA